MQESKEISTIKREQKKLATLIVDCKENKLPELEKELTEELIQLFEKHYKQRIAEGREVGRIGFHIELEALNKFFGEPDNSEFYLKEATILLLETEKERILCRLIAIKNKEPDLTSEEISEHYFLMGKFKTLSKELDPLYQTRYWKPKK